MQRSDHNKMPAEHHTLFSKRSAHWFRPVLPVTPGHWLWPGSCQVCQMVLGVICKRPRWKFLSVLLQYISRLWENRFKFGHWVFCELLLRPFDKIKMTQGRGWWPRDIRKLGWFSCAKHSEKSVQDLGNSDNSAFSNMIPIFGESKKSELW